MSSEPELVVAPSADQLADDVAGRFVATVVAAQSVRPLAFVAVTAGGILEQVMRALARLPIRDSVDWARVSLWWADERFVSADSPDRNDQAAFAALFDQLDLDPVNVHRMPAAGAEYGDDADAAALGYAAELAAAVPPAQRGDEGSPGAAAHDIPRFDVILLGIGPDGHCASLFPGHPATSIVDTSVVAVHGSPKPPRPGCRSLSAPSTRPTRSGSSRPDRARPRPLRSPGQGPIACRSHRPAPAVTTARCG